MKTIEELNEAFSHIPKYCRCTVGNDDNRYYPIIIKKDWEHARSSYVAMYAKYGRTYINPENYLFKVEAEDFQRCVEKFIEKIDRCRKQGKLCGNCWNVEKEEIDTEQYDYPQPPLKKPVIIP